MALKEELSPEDKEFIIKNYNNQSVYAMAMRLNVKTKGRECPIITDFIQSQNLKPETAPAPSTVDIKQVEKSVEEVVKTIVEDKLVIDNADDIDTIENTTIEEFSLYLKRLGITLHEALTEREKHDIKYLMKQMDSSRFLLTCRTYRKKECRQLFRDEFVKAMFGKGEMPQEEVNDFLDYINEIVYQYDLKCKIRDIEKIKDDPKATTGQKMQLQATVGELYDKYSASLETVGSIKKRLGANREQRLKESRPEGMNIVSLIEAFHDDEKRKVMLALESKKDAEITKSLDLLDQMEETKALILGISREEILNGGL